MDRIIFGYDLINGSDEDYDNLINYLRNYLHAVQMNKSVWALTNGRETPESIVNKLISNVKCQIRAFAFILVLEMCIIYFALLNH